MPEATETAGFLSIGEVLGLLLEEFPDITISKIRFLESQGLISPERTASGYRKFYDADVQLLRVILAEQRENYLPLRVIKDRLDSGEIDPTGEHIRPNGDITPTGGTDRGPTHTATGSLPASSGDHRVDHRSGDAGHDDDDAGGRGTGDHDDDHTPAEVPRAAIRSHPAARGLVDRDADPATDDPVLPADQPAAHVAGHERPAATPQLLPGVLLDRAELCAMVGMTDAELAQLEEYGVVSAKQGSYPALYGDDAVEISKPACEFLRAGLDARHLRSWRTSAEREASLYEQLITPRYRQRNPESRAEALAQLRRLDALGGVLRAAMTRQALRHHFEA
jgi:DNA-binding transcriptional MerR regulator